MRRKPISAAIRLATLACFFHFSGIHNGYSQMSVSAPNIGQSVQTISGLAHQAAESIYSQAVSPSLRWMLSGAVELTLTVRTRALQAIRSSLRQAQGRMAFAAERAGQAIQGSLDWTRHQTLNAKREDYLKLKKESWLKRAGKGEFEFTLDIPWSGERRDINPAILEAFFAIEKLASKAARTAFRLNARSDTGDASHTMIRRSK